MIAALLFAGGTGDDKSPSSDPSQPAALPPISIAAPPSNPAAAAPCTALLGALPVALPYSGTKTLAGRPAQSSSSFVVAWGQPPVVLRCGVTRPADLHPGSSTVFVTAGSDDGPYFDVVSDHADNIWTTVDRAVYVEIRVPAVYNSGPLPALSAAIAKVMPAVCAGGANRPGESAAPSDQLCAERK